jgi:hypothetical protein
MGATFRSHLEVFQWQTGLSYSAHEGHIPQLALPDGLEFILHLFCRELLTVDLLGVQRKPIEQTKGLCQSSHAEENINLFMSE